jgi:hypothetical protein
MCPVQNVNYVPGCTGLKTPHASASVEEQI